MLPCCLGCAEQELSPRRRDRVELEHDLAQQAEKAERWLLWWGAQGYDLAQQAEEAARWLPPRTLGHFGDFKAQRRADKKQHGLGVPQCSRTYGNKVTDG